MLESFFLSQHLNTVEPNFVDTQPRQTTSQEIKHTRNNLIATNSPVDQNFDRFLLKESEAEETKIIPDAKEVKKNHIKEALQFVRKFLPKKPNNVDVKAAIIECKKIGGDFVSIETNGGLTQGGCETNFGEQISNTRVDFKIAQFVENYAVKGFDGTKVKLNLITKPDGKRVIGTSVVDLEKENKNIAKLNEKKEFYNNIIHNILPKYEEAIKQDLLTCANLNGAKSSIVISAINGETKFDCNNTAGVINNPNDNGTIGLTEFADILGKYSKGELKNIVFTFELKRNIQNDLVVYPKIEFRD